MGEGRGELILKIILFCVLAGVTLACHTFVERYEQSGPEMLSDHWAVQGDQAARAGGVKGELVLVSTDPAGSAGFRQEVLGFEPGAILKLSADMRCENVQPGEKAWNRARLLLVQNDGKKDRYDLPHQAAALSGTREWEHYQGLFTLGPNMEKIWVVAQLSRCTGSFSLGNIHLYPVTQVKFYTHVKNILLFLWGIYFIFLLGSCFVQGRQQIILQGMLVLAFAAIIIGTTLPGEIKVQVSKQVEAKIHAATNAVADRSIPWDLTKVGHFCFFAVFGMVLGLLLNQESAGRVMVHILLLAGGTEVAQFFVDGRSPVFWDFVIDAVGGFSGVALVWWYSRKTRHIKVEI